MALDILSIPAISTEPERCFSSIKLTISPLRGSMGMDTLEALEHMKSWQKLVDTDVELELKQYRALFTDYNKRQEELAAAALLAA
jgi:lysozyme family protein